MRGKERNSPSRRCRSISRPCCAKICSAACAPPIVTSATLAAEQRFDFLEPAAGARRPGARRRARRSTHRRSTFRGTRGSPIPTNAPAPNVDAPAHIQFVVRAVLDVATASDGGMFVLATSHRDVRLVAAELRARGVERRWPLLVHGDDGRDCAAASLSRERACRARRDRELLGRRRRSRARAARARHHEAAVQGAERTGDGGALRVDRATRRRRVSRVHAAARVAATEAGIRPTHSHGDRPRRHRSGRPARHLQVVRPHAARRAAARATARGCVARRCSSTFRRSTRDSADNGLARAFTTRPSDLTYSSRNDRTTPIEDRLRRPQLPRARARARERRAERSR